jgi:hypothetical protein
MRRAGPSFISGVAVALALGLAVLIPDQRAFAQGRPFVGGGAGLAFDLNEQAGETGGGFGYYGDIGIRFRSLAIGGEYQKLQYGDDRKARTVGGFVRAHAFDTQQVSPYLVLGIAAYRFSPVAGGSTNTVGGSFGLGTLVRLGDSGLRLQLEARFHTSFDQYANLTRQELLAATAGVQWSF